MVCLYNHVIYFELANSGLYGKSLELNIHLTKLKATDSDCYRLVSV